MSEPSTLSKGLLTIDTTLHSVNDLLGRARPPILDLVVVINMFDGYIAGSEEFFSFIEKVLNVIHECLQLCRHLGQLIPVVGQTLSTAAKFIESSQIEQTVRKVVDKMKEIIKNVRASH